MLLPTVGSGHGPLNVNVSGITVDLRALAKLILKLVGFYLVVSVLVGVPPLVAAPGSLLVGNVVYGITLVVVGAALIWFPGTIANRVLRIEGTTEEQSLSAPNALRVGLILLGFYLLVGAVAGLLSAYVRFELYCSLTSCVFPESVRPGMTPEDMGYVASLAAQAVLGVVLCRGSRVLTHLSGGFDVSR